MSKYIVNFLCDIDITLECESEEEAKAIAEDLIGTEHDEGKHDYIYFRDVLAIQEGN